MKPRSTQEAFLFLAPMIVIVQLRGGQRIEHEDKVCAEHWNVQFSSRGCGPSTGKATRYLKPMHG
eukprot:scaffold626_cov337-Pavlova_lutheri.AAC.64